MRNCTNCGKSFNFSFRPFFSKKSLCEGKSSTLSGACISPQDYHPNRTVNKALSSLSKPTKTISARPGQTFSGRLHPKSSSGDVDEVSANLEIGQEIT
jgi:hypothetical protein